MLIKEMHDNGLIALEALIVALSISYSLLISSPVIEIGKNSLRIEVQLLSLLHLLYPLDG